MPTWPGPGDRISRSTISKSPLALETCATFIFAILYLPLVSGGYALVGAKRFRMDTGLRGIARSGTNLQPRGLRASGKDSYTGGPALWRGCGWVAR